MQKHKELHLLLVGLASHNIQHILEILKQNGYRPDYRELDQLEDAKSYMTEPKIGIVICDYGIISNMPDGHGSSNPSPREPALLVLAPQISVWERKLAQQAGASEIFSVNDLSRLPDAIENCLRESRIRATQAALEENQARLSSFIANLPGMAYQIRVEPEGRVSFSYVSEGSMALLGLPPEELEQDATLFTDLLHPDDLASYKKTMQLAIAKSSFWNWEGRIIMAASGEHKWINLRCSPRQQDTPTLQWEGVMFNITQSKKAEIELNRSREELRALSLHAQDVREQERLNISREVHDNLGGLLTAIKLEFVRLNGLLPSQTQEAEISTRIEGLIDKSMAAASDISRALRPGALDSFGLVAALELEIDEFRKRTGIQCAFTNTDEFDEPDPDLDIALFRIFQEALTNIIKHANATQVKIDIDNQNARVNLAVADNGCGIADLDTQKPHSFGLKGIRERVTHLGGKLDISSIAGKGTTIFVSIPRTSASPNGDLAAAVTPKDNET